MIPVQLPPAPSHYKADVWVPGRAFLAANPNPTSNDWDNHRYWKHIHEYLHDQLRKICMYCASFTPRDPSGRWGDSSIDHFIPKSVPDHKQAYEWNNFRLCRVGLNNSKASHQDVLDPCTIQNRWFQLKFTTLAIHPDPNLDAGIQQQVQASLMRLHLNDDERYVNERARAIYAYADNKMTFIKLCELYPFIAAEMTAQDFDNVHLPRFQRMLTSPKLRTNLTALGWV